MKEHKGTLSPTLRIVSASCLSDGTWLQPASLGLGVGFRVEGVIDIICILLPGINSILNITCSNVIFLDLLSAFVFFLLDTPAVCVCCQ